MHTLASLALAAVGAGSLVACGKTASKEDCEQAFVHTIDLAVAGQDKAAAEVVKKQMERDEKGGFVKECEGKAMKSEVDCIIAAKTSDDIDKCK